MGSQATDLSDAAQYGQNAFHTTDGTVPKFARRPQALSKSWDTFGREKYGVGTVFPRLVDLLEEYANNTSGMFPCSVRDIERRGLEIDIRALAFICSSAVGRDDVPVLTVFATGSYNMVFLAKFQNGSEVLVRVPFADSRSPRVTESSVATMAYANFCLNIPCPNVLAWEDGQDNPICSPYIVSERVRGSSLHSVWHGLTFQKQCDVLIELAGFHSALARKLPFEAFGCLVFADGDQHSRGLEDSAAYKVGPLVCLRDPMVGTHHVDWPSQRTADIRALWKGKYLKQLEAMKDRWIYERSGAVADADKCFDCPLEPLMEAAAGLLELIDTCELTTCSEPCLVHPDLAFRNIIVDKTNYRIKAVLDWDGAAILPRALLPPCPRDLCDEYHRPPPTFAGGSELYLFRFLPPEVFGHVDDLDFAHYVPPGSLAKGSDEMQLVSFFHLIHAGNVDYYAGLRRIYRTVLTGWDERLNDGFWRSVLQPQIVHFFVSNGFRLWGMPDYQKWLIDRRWQPQKPVLASQSQPQLVGWWVGGLRGLRRRYFALLRLWQRLASVLR